MNKKAVALLSGGLDSTLAIKMVLDQGIEVVAINFTTPFCKCSRHKDGCRNEAKNVTSKLGIELKIIGLTTKYFEIIKHPKHGYGSQINPCIDCRILMLKESNEYMLQIGASFIITGEVLGQRPMSQRRDAIKLIEKETGLEGLVLRPLSAKLFPPTIPEISGVIDRKKLLSISGRRRKPQMGLASEYGIRDYPCPAGGCSLTEPGFSRRLKDLLKYTPDFVLDDVIILSLGRHFRLSPKAKAIVGRNKDENEKLIKLARSNDILFEIKDSQGPITILRGEYNQIIKEKSASITARYSDIKDKKAVPIILWEPASSPMEIIVSPMEEEEIEKYRV